MKRFKLFFQLIILSIFSCTSKNMKEANQIINKIEHYRKLNNKLPDNLNSLGIKETEEGPFFYKKINSKNYIIWGQSESSLGDSEIYYSDSKKWEKGYREIKVAPH